MQVSMLAQVSPDSCLACRHGEKVTVYKFYVSEEGAPVRLYMHGNDVFSGAHFDKYGFAPPEHTVTHTCCHGYTRTASNSQFRAVVSPLTGSCAITSVR